MNAFNYLKWRIDRDMHAVVEAFIELSGTWAEEAYLKASNTGGVVPNKAGCCRRLNFYGLVLRIFF